mmetsp:Transcript_25221/g.29082  ORF Transcript_25221/g.29082 Transcript_25221/m.29082 type:complete len:105 (+) Transcript_25221:555-869(+)
MQNDVVLSKKSSSMSKGSNRKMLSLRADVMNKNLFRALRRECKGMFESFCIENNLSMSRKQRSFFPNIELFASNLFEENQDLCESESEFNMKDFEIYLGIFFNY